MWNSWSNERKTYTVLVALILVLVIGYFTSIRRTLDGWGEYTRLKQVGQQTSIAEFSELQRRYKVLDSTYSIISGIDYDKLLIKEISELLKNRRVEITELKNQELGGQVIDVVTFSGTYHELIRLIYHFEQHFYVGSLFSTRFRTETDNRTKVTRLYADIYIQRLSDGKVD